MGLRKRGECVPPTSDDPGVEFPSLERELLRPSLIVPSVTLPMADPVAHTFETYEGDHSNRIPQRLEEKVLPFFSNNLSFEQRRESSRR